MSDTKSGNDIVTYDDDGIMRTIYRHVYTKKGNVIKLVENDDSDSLTIDFIEVVNMKDRKGLVQKLKRMMNFCGHIRNPAKVDLTVDICYMLCLNTEYIEEKFTDVIRSKMLEFTKSTTISLSAKRQIND